MGLITNKLKELLNIVSKKPLYNPLPETREEPPPIPPEFDPFTFNILQLDQMYLYKHALVMACQQLEELEPNKKMQEHFDTLVENAGAFIININDKETISKGV